MSNEVVPIPQDRQNEQAEVVQIECYLMDFNTNRVVNRASREIDKEEWESASHEEREELLQDDEEELKEDYLGDLIFGWHEVTDADGTLSVDDVLE